MNGSDLAKKIADQTDVSMASAKAVVDLLFGAIGDAAARGEEVSIPGFGKFKVKQTAARTGRNPRTGDPMDIAASRKVAFTPAKALKDKLAS